MSSLNKFSLLNLKTAAIQKPQIWGLPLSVAALFLLIIRIFGVKPAIMQDEMIYAKYSRLLPMSEAPIPDYLFYWIFSSTKACGPNFYSCGKAINLIAFVALAFVIYLIARKVTSRAAAWFVSVAVLFSPIGYYSSFFMPEMLFFLSLALLVLAMLSYTSMSSHISWFVLGMGLGLAALTKPHALFFGAVIGLYIVFLEKSSSRFKLRVVITKTASAALGSIVSKLTLGFLFAGVNGLSIFGSSYSGTISAAAPEISPISNVSQESSVSQITTTPLLAIFGLQTWGHFLAAVILFCVPLSIAFNHLSKKPDGTSSLSIQKKMAIISLGAVGVGIITIALFTALITVNGSDHTSRVMVRYYDYIVPFMYILLALGFANPSLAKSPKISKIFALVVVAGAAIGAYSNMSPFRPAFYDGTSLAAIKSDQWFTWLILGLSVAIIVGMFFAAKTTKWLSGVLLFALSFGLSAIGVKNIDPLRIPDRFDYAASFASNYLSEDELDSLTVIAYEDYALARTLLLIDNPNVDYRVISKGETFGSAFLDKGKEWVLLVGNTFIDQQGCLRQQGSGYVLVKLCDSPEFYFNQSLPSSLIDSVSGISYPEDWGSWTIGNRAVINFAEPLPANAKIQITMSAPPFTMEQDFVASVGNSSIVFNLSDEAIDGDFEFENTAPATQLVIDVPKPKSEKGAGRSSDSREVGIMLYKVKVLK